MKKVFRLIPLLFVLLLTSCGTENVYGTYEFRLGKPNSTHFGFTANLTSDTQLVIGEETKEKVEGEGKEAIQWKVFSINFVSSLIEKQDEEGTKSLIKRSHDIFSESGSEHSSLLDLLNSGLDLTIKGFYKISTKNNRNVVNVDIIHILGLDLGSLNIDEGTWDYLFLATLDKNILNIRVPVSMKDLEKQITWISEGNDASSPVPTKKENPNLFFHTVTIGLIKK